MFYIHMVGAACGAVGVGHVNCCAVVFVERCCGVLRNTQVIQHGAEVESKLSCSVGGDEFCLS